MKIHALKVNGIGCFHDQEISLPIEELGDAAVIAVTGLNGAGKSSLLECVPGLLYGDTPSHGPTAAMANAKDSYVEGTIETDQVYRLRRTINATLKKPKIEAYLWSEDGTPIGESDGKQTTFTTEIGKRFPSQAVFLSSGFASQGRAGQFLEISKADRKALFADLLGLEHLQGLSKSAAEHAKTLDAKLTELRAKVAAFEEQAANRGHLTTQAEGRRSDLEHAKEAVKKAETEAVAARERLEKWREQAAKLDQRVIEAQAELREAKQAHGSIGDQMIRAKKDLARVTSEGEVLQAKLDQKDQLEAVVATVDDDRLPQIDAEIAEIRKAVDVHHDAERGWRSRRDDAEKSLQACRDAYKETLDKTKNDVKLAQQRHEAATKTASGLGKVTCLGEGKYAACPLIKTATEAAKDLDALHCGVENAESQFKKAKANTAAGLEAKATLEAVGDAPTPPDSSQLPPLEQEAKELRARQMEVADAKIKLDVLTEVEKALIRLSAEWDALSAEQAANSDTLADKVKFVASAEGRLLAIQDKHAVHEDTKPQSIDESTLAGLRRQETELVADLARLETQAAEATAATEKMEQAGTEIRTVTGDVDDWRHLQKAFGREGIQSLEVDAAGPEVSSLINELLSACYGSRFVVKLETTAPLADGKGNKEIFDLHVLDTEKGWEGSASNLSGGERVFVTIALGLAIAICNAQRSSIPILDIVLDECSGALDFEKAPLYVAMLRKAVEVGGFHRIFFVVHQRDLWSLADAQLEVVDGQCRVVGL